MKRVMSLLLMWILQLTAHSQTLGVVDGRILKAGSTEAVPKAIVELKSVAGDSVKYRVAAVDDGRFSFANVQPGAYRLGISSDGFVATEYGKRKTGARGAVIEVAAGQPVHDLQVSMTPTGAISGHVIDNTGRPAVKAEVQALKVSYQDGRRVFTPVQSAVTNDLGEYRLFWLAPGSYFVSAIAPVWGTAVSVAIVIGPGAPVTGLAGSGGGGTGGFNPLAPASLPDDKRDPAARYETVYYPNTVDDQAAQSIDVPPAGEANADIVFSSFVRTRHVRLQVADETNAPAPTQIRISNLPAVVGNRVPNPFNAAGKYETDISTVPTVISVNAPFGPPLPTAPQVPLRLGRVSIPAGESDLDVTVPLKTGRSLQGRVVVESSEANAPKPTAFRVTLVSEPRGLILPFVIAAEGAVSDNGTFTLPNVFDGDHHVSITPVLNLASATVAIPAALQHAYVKSVRFGDVDVLNGVLHMPAPPESTLSIVIANNAASLSGIAVNDKQEADSDSTVVLLPVNRNRTDLIRVATTDASGKFRLDRIPPGDYKLFAWDDVEPGAWQDPQFIQSFEDRGMAVHVEEGTTPDVRVVVIPRYH